MAGCDAGNPNIECACLKSSEIEAHIQQRDMEELQNLNQYCVENAWFKVDLEAVPMEYFLQCVLLNHCMPLRMDWLLHA